MSRHHSRLSVVVAGARGQLGSQLVAEFAAAGHRVVALSRAELDVTAPDAGDRIAALAPDVVINATAWNDVDGAEANADAAFAVNADAVANMAEAAARAGARFVHYSSDFVFDGMAAQPYDEHDATAPLNTYGRSKVAGEVAAARAGRHYVLRLASVFGGGRGQGAGGRSSIDRMAEALLRGDEVRAFADRTVSPSYTEDVARATRILIANGGAPGVYHCVSSGHTTWVGVASYIGELLGVETRIVPVSARDVALTAARPQFCALSNSKLSAAGVSMPSWQDALRRHAVRRWAPARTGRAAPDGQSTPTEHGSPLQPLTSCTGRVRCDTQQPSTFSRATQ